jgi:HSP20 family molecular chaperone IbpA
MSALVSGNWIRNNWLDDMFREVDPAYYVKPLHGQSLPRPGQIRMDVKETDAAYTVEAEMPGVKKQDIQVSIDGSTITLSAEIKQVKKPNGEPVTIRGHPTFSPNIPNKKFVPELRTWLFLDDQGGQHSFNPFTLETTFRDI